MTHPAVMEACVVGVPDALLGEAIEAWVVIVRSATSRYCCAIARAPWRRSRSAAFAFSTPCPECLGQGAEGRPARHSNFFRISRSPCRVRA